MTTTIQRSPRGRGRPSAPVLTPEQKAKLLELYQLNVTQAELSERFNVARATVARYARLAGLPARPVGPRLLVDREMPPHVAKAAELWRTQWTIEEMARLLGRNAPSLGPEIVRWRKWWPEAFPRRFVKRK